MGLGLILEHPEHLQLPWIQQEQPQLEHFKHLASASIGKSCSLLWLCIRLFLKHSPWMFPSCLFFCIINYF